jgi:branched-chain amino acid transport system ATP-binding protein
VYFDANDITGLAPHEICKKGLVRTWQIPQPFSKLTVLENLIIADRCDEGEGPISSVVSRSKWIAKEEEMTEKAFRMIKFLKLDAVWDQPSYTLSGGQAKLLEAGRALISGANMLIMDEPAAGVNPTLAKDMFNTLTDLNRKTGVTFLLIEHRLEIALPHVNMLYVMNNGQLIARGRPEEVINDSRVIESYLGG